MVRSTTVRQGSMPDNQVTGPAGNWVGTQCLQVLGIRVRAVRQGREPVLQAMMKARYNRESPLFLMGIGQIENSLSLQSLGMAKVNVPMHRW